MMSSPDGIQTRVVQALNAHDELGKKSVSGLIIQVFTKSLRRATPLVTRHPRLMMLGRGLSKPFPSVAARLCRLATTPDSSGTSGVQLSGATLPSDHSGAHFGDAQRNTDDSAFIVDIYRGLLWRDPDEDGMRYYGNSLKNATLDPVGVINAIRLSKEFSLVPPVALRLRLARRSAETVDANSQHNTSTTSYKAVPLESVPPRGRANACKGDQFKNL